MKRLVLLLGLAAALLAPVAASAHPLGNFTINRFSRVEVAGRTLYVRYVLDLAEIPAYQARQQGVDPAAYARRIASNLHVSVGGRAVRLVPVAHALAFPLGQGGLHTMRLELVLRGPAVRGATGLHFHDANYAGRIGWKEIVVGAGTHSISGELHAYPRDLLQSPLAQTSVTATLRPTHDPVPTVSHGPQLAARDRAVADGGFASLIAHDRLSVGFVLVSILVAAFWGAAHAFSPGHGKSVITAYLVGSRGTPRHALILGLTTTITHTVGVFALGLVTLALSQFVVPEELYPWLNLAAALLVLGVGLSVLCRRFGDWRHARAHRHGHAHDHEHAHEHVLSLRTLLGVGVSGGIIPCPTALVVLLAAISLHRVGYGLVLIVAFSIGLAAAITGIGLLAVSAKRLFSRVDFDGRAVRLLPAASALVIVGLGIAMTARAVPGLG